MTIAITGASGPLGRTTADLLLQTVDPREVVLLTRHPAALADLANRDVQVRLADFNEPSTLESAFDGVDRLLLISTDATGSRLDPQRAAIAAAAAAGVRHIVYTSMPGLVPDNPAHGVADHAGTEQALRDSDLAWTSLRNNLYAHMQIPGIEYAVVSGRLLTNTGAGAAAYVTREDCAAAGVAVLTQDGHEGMTYDITGPEALSGADLAALAQKFYGCEVAFGNLDDDKFSVGLQAAGLPSEVAALVTSFGASTRGGYFANVSTAVADLTGHNPTPLGDLIRATQSV